MQELHNQNTKIYKSPKVNQNRHFISAITTTYYILKIILQNMQYDSEEGQYNNSGKKSSMKIIGDFREIRRLKNLTLESIFMEVYVKSLFA